VSALLWYLAPFSLLPAALLLLVGPVARLVFFLLGLAFCLGIGFVMDLGGPDSPGLIIPFFGLVLSAGAIIAEALYRLWKMVRSRVRAHG
jgi:hypothetical protein